MICCVFCSGRSSFVDFRHVAASFFVVAACFVAIVVATSAVANINQKDLMRSVIVSVFWNIVMDCTKNLLSKYHTWTNSELLIIQEGDVEESDAEQGTNGSASVIVDQPEESNMLPKNVIYLHLHSKLLGLREMMSVLLLYPCAVLLLFLCIRSTSIFRLRTMKIEKLLKTQMRNCVTTLQHIQ